MADITKCSGENCSRKESCYRFTVIDSPYRQSYFVNPPLKKITHVMIIGKIIMNIKQDLKMKNKKILYIDMDGVVADFHAGVKALDSRIGEDFSNPNLVDELVEANPTLFENLLPIKGAMRAVHLLMRSYDVYFLSTPMWNVPESFKGKRIWLEKYFGEYATKRLILTHRKDLNIGDYLIDDRTKNGSGEFKGELIQFATEKYPDWDSVLNKLL